MSFPWRALLVGLIAPCLWGCPSDPPADAPAAAPAAPAQPVDPPPPVTHPAPPPAPTLAPAAPDEPASAQPEPAHVDPPPGGGVSPEDQALARQLNTEGYRLYKDKRYTEAIPRFEDASRADPYYALPPYNLACTLCLVRGGGGTCENDAYKDRILTQLERSISLDPARLDRARDDSDLECVRDTLRYQRLMGYEVEDPADVEHILTHVSWYGPAPGAFGNMSGLKFEAGGGVKLWVLEVTDEVKTLHFTGRWTVKGNKITVTLDQATPSGEEGFTGTLTGSGLKTSGSLGPFSDLPSECSA